MLEIKGKCGVCQMEFRRPAAARVPAGYCAACWEKADRHLQERDDLADRQAADPAGHYRHVIRAPITDEDIARGYTEVKLDPYRVCDIYATGGGPREQMVKKLLRWTDKGQSEERVIGEIESALKRWKEMREEDAACR
ncbi:hypothetical protein RAN53_09485 [Halomonas sp. SSL-5]|uniref:hypothetical protein n=1 Tax=Halomonas sp. SSL-5 TaxID=3065855 RepID=UPI0027382F77|nr:hypothetical protein [Halomonas sp. SSL-5]MDY7116582.1 hypothetical protein [Halomonas sp. SSL-5]